MEYHLIITAIAVPLVSVICAGILSYFTATNSVSQQARITQAAAAYADYLTAVAKRKFAQSEGDYICASAEVAATKARTALYGTPEVIAALAEFERMGPSTTTNPDLFLQAVMAMRGHAWKEKQLSRDLQDPLSKDIKTLLLGPASPKEPISAEQSGDSP